MTAKAVALHRSALKTKPAGSGSAYVEREDRADVIAMLGGASIVKMRERQMIKKGQTSHMRFSELYLPADEANLREAVYLAKTNQGMMDVEQSFDKAYSHRSQFENFLKMDDIDEFIQSRPTEDSAMELAA